jgi:hypothetical protein
VHVAIWQCKLIGIQIPNSKILKNIPRNVTLAVPKCNKISLFLVHQENHKKLIAFSGFFACQQDQTRGHLPPRYYT